MLLPGMNVGPVLATPSARQALLFHYVDLRKRAGSGSIALPAQICPIVPAVIRTAGLEPLFLDGDGLLPTPSPEQYSAVLAGSSVIGILVAPMGGYVQDGWSTLLPRIPTTVDLTVDLAQAPFSTEALGPDFLSRADAITFSFGVGKGFDTGGGLLVSKRSIPPPEVVRASGPLVWTTVARSAAIRLAMGLGAYRALLPFVDRMAATDLAVAPMEQAEANVALCWLARHRTLESDFERAATRSAVLGRLGAVQRSCHDVSVTCTDAARPLRQLLRLRPGVDRNGVVRAFRAAGLDCAPGGEPFPVGADPHQWPAAELFTRDAVRLPFLGRLSSRGFDRACSIIEKVLTAHGL
ncbi:MAG: hypothetical protein KA385_02305 [Vicinamibacteria bacterium]|nr:hypothetical protein [Vicinamibacteria bacterium]